MRQLKAMFCTLLIAWLLAAGPVIAQDQAKPALHVDTFDSPVQQVAWLSYGVGLATFVSENNLSGVLPTGTWQPSFDAEVFARRFQLKAWKEIKETQAVSYEFMDHMELVDSADFLEEYIWHFYQRPDWPVPEELRLEEFDVWAETNLKDHRPITGATVTIER